jgi:hypothetical protein
VDVYFHFPQNKERYMFQFPDQFTFAQIRTFLAKYKHYCAPDSLVISAGTDVVPDTVHVGPTVRPLGFSFRVTQKETGPVPLLLGLIVTSDNDSPTELVLRLKPGTRLSVIRERLKPIVQAPDFCFSFLWPEGASRCGKQNLDPFSEHCFENCCRIVAGSLVRLSGRSDAESPKPLAFLSI